MYEEGLLYASDPAEEPEMKVVTLADVRQSQWRERKIHDQSVEIISLRARVEQLENDLVQLWQRLTPAQKKELKQELQL